MDSSASLVSLKRSSSRRTPSLSPSTSSLSSSSSSYSSSSFLEPSYFPGLRRGSVSPSFPLAPVASSGVPFSWEKIPGIPKNQLSWKMAGSPSTSLLLPLPPAASAAAAAAAASLSSKKHRLSRTTSATRYSKRDPFVSAFLKCSKDAGREMTGNHWAVARVSRRISNGLGFVNLASCKQTCAVSDSVIYVARSNRASSDLFLPRIGRA